MKKAQKKLSLMKSKESVIDRIFAKFCDGYSVAELAKEFEIPLNTLQHYATKEKWLDRRKTILSNVRNDIDEQIKIEKRNEALVGLMIKKINTKRMVKEYEAYQTKGRLPSFLGTSTQEYKANIELAKILMNEDEQKLNIKVGGKLNHTVAKLTPEQMSKILDAVCKRKGIPIPSVPGSIGDDE